MLIRIALIVAIVAGLAAASLNFIKLKEKITTLQTTLKNTQNELAATKTELDKTKTDLDKTAQDLKKTQTELADTQKERDTAVTEAAAQKKQAASLRDQLTKMKQERDEAQTDLAAWKALGPSVDQIKVIIALSKRLQTERDDLAEKKKDVESELRRTQNELARYKDPEGYKPPLPPGLKGNVVAVDPKFDFVVLDVGENQGVLEHGEMLVSRNGKLVAKVHIWNVQRERCVANVLPAWKLTDVVEGDLVVPAL